MSIFSKIIGDSNERYLKKLQPIVQKINALENDFEKFSDEELKNKTADFKKRLQTGETFDGILTEAFALVRESAKRTLSQRHFDVQLLGGIVLHQGKIAEMKTGEGKTLVATLTAYLNALEGKGVHIVTVNDYLSRRDTVWMGQIYYFLGLNVGCLNHDTSYIYDSSHTDRTQNLNLENELDKIRDTEGSFRVVHEFLRPCSRREAYEADITYGTNNEFGFDYLRDNLVYDKNQLVQSSSSQILHGKALEDKHNFAIIDEVDSILIDEARTPLIISMPDAESEELYKVFSRLIQHLREEDGDYTIDEKMKAAPLTEKGIEKIEKILGVKDIYTEKGIKYVHHLEQSLRAKVFFQRDRDYVVSAKDGNGEIIIVDEFTGRLMPGRRWSDGLHQAIEAKEGVIVQRESRTAASITFQNYFRLYKKLAGMTGTALTSAEEFSKVYGLEVVAVPTNKPLIRKDLSDKIFQTENGKFKAVAEQIKECQKIGQPVLVGTISIEKNELLSAMLSREGIRHNVLNAKNHEKEAEIISQAGKFGAVTIATNMAGRGVDIMLGGFFDDSTVKKEDVINAGGIFVIGTERHEARRIDNQLRGRSGRQGDPGKTQFFVSLEDDLLRIFGGDRLKNMMSTFNIPEEQPIENKLVSRALESAQAKVEGFNFDARKYTLEYDDVANKHRQKIYEFRKRILLAESESLEKEFYEIIEEERGSLLNFYTQGEKENWNMNILFEILKDRLKAEENEILDFKSATEVSQNSDDLRENLADMFQDILENSYQRKKRELGENFPAVLKSLFLQIIDLFWLSHLETMEYTKSSVRLRAYGQRDPLVEYKNEAVKLFRELESAIKQNIFFSFFQLGKAAGHSHELVRANQNLDKSSAGKKKIGRNAPCPCGSGKKFKKCHGK